MTAPAALSLPAHTLARGAVVFDAAARARVRLVGKDARSFLHRLSTNAVDKLEAGQGRLNVLTTDKGRLVDVLHHLDRGDHVLLLGSPGQGPALMQWFDKYLFTEQVELVDDSAAGDCVLVAGGGAAAVLLHAFDVDASALPPWGFAARDGVVVARTFDRVDEDLARVPAFLVVTAAAGARDRAVAAGAVAADAAADETLRIAAGVPQAPGEIGDAFNPLDLGLHDGIHWAKGCYIGQEVIARLDTYQKQRKGLAAVALPSDVHVAVGDVVLVDGASIGAITSVAPASFAAAPRALAVLKRGDPPATQALLRTAAGEVPVALSTPAVAQLPHD